MPKTKKREEKKKKREKISMLSQSVNRFCETGVALTELQSLAW